jgi:hypothetical protein
MNKFYLTLAAAVSLSFVACSGKSDTGETGVTGESDADADADADGDADPTFSVDWGGSAVTLAIGGGTSTYLWGIAETGGSADPWTGEDCAYGYTLSDGSVLGPYCHDAGASGISLTYGGSATDLTEGTTVFTDNSFSSSTTHYTESAEGACWVWGTDVSYYDGLGCTAM